MGQGAESLRMEIKVLYKGTLLDNGHWVFTKAMDKEVFKGCDKTKVMGHQLQAAADCLCAMGWNSGKTPSPTMSLIPSAWWHGTDIMDKWERQISRVLDMRPSQALEPGTNRDMMGQSRVAAYESKADIKNLVEIIRLPAGLDIRPVLGTFGMLVPELGTGLGTPTV